MKPTLEVIIFYILLIDSIGANLLVWFGSEKWYGLNFRLMSRFFPLSKGWAAYYLLLVLWMGLMLYRLGAPIF
ncbi:MAG: hypothetical protein Q8P45_00725 [Candidatus Harrisonbacteria bacterium]|nr:hypothetical protein [Candidatus Harrisonbacteria bacterium]